MDNGEVIPLEDFDSFRGADALDDSENVTQLRIVYDIPATTVEPEKNYEWRNQANCNNNDDREVFLESFEIDIHSRVGKTKEQIIQERATETVAKLVCEKCVVRRECLNYAIDNDIDVGIWGKMNGRERRYYGRHTYAYKYRLGKLH